MPQFINLSDRSKIQLEAEKKRLGSLWAFLFLLGLSVITARDDVSGTKNTRKKIVYLGKQ